MRKHGESVYILLPAAFFALEVQNGEALSPVSVCGLAESLDRLCEGNPAWEGQLRSPPPFALALCSLNWRPESSLSGQVPRKSPHNCFRISDHGPLRLSPFPLILFWQDFFRFSLCANMAGARYLSRKRFFA